MLTSSWLGDRHDVRYGSDPFPVGLETALGNSKDVLEFRSPSTKTPKMRGSMMDDKQRSTVYH